jgi:peptidoglycan/xylan/chitin deacetylase (PgdA/CDA1 family)
MPKQETKEAFTQIPPPSPSCIPIKKEPLNPEKKYKAVLRFDSIDGDTPLAVLKKIVIDTERYHIPLTLSIIPEKIDEYPELKKFLKNESCNIELAIHGWDNFSAQSTTGNTRFLSEFSEISYSDALERIKNAKEKLNDLTHEPIITLVPPFNLISEA